MQIYTTMITLSQIQTKKDFIISELQPLSVGDKITIDGSEVQKWKYNISVNVHPNTDKRYRVQTDKAIVPAGKAYVLRLK